MPVEYSPELDSYLKQFESRRYDKPPVAVFDCDGTIIKGDIGEAMFYYQLERFLIRTSPSNLWLDHPKREELDNLYNALAALPPDKRLSDRRFVSFSETMVEWYFTQLKDGKTEKACSDIVRLFARFTEEEVRNIANACFQEEIQSPLTTRKFGKHTVSRGVRYVLESVKLLTELQRLGFDIWAVSGSNKWSVEPVFERFGLPKEKVIGIELTSTSTVFSAKVKTPVPVLEGKVEAIQIATGTAPEIVISDSTYDVPLFNAARSLKVLVNTRMETSYSFFKHANIVQDDSWVVIENPTLI